MYFSWQNKETTSQISLPGTACSPYNVRENKLFSCILAFNCSSFLFWFFGENDAAAKLINYRWTKSWFLRQICVVSVLSSCFIVINYGKEEKHVEMKIRCSRLQNVTCNVMPPYFMKEEREDVLFHCICLPALLFSAGPEWEGFLPMLLLQSFFQGFILCFISEQLIYLWLRQKIMWDSDCYISLARYN